MNAKCWSCERDFFPSLHVYRCGATSQSTTVVTKHLRYSRHCAVATSWKPPGMGRLLQAAEICMQEVYGGVLSGTTPGRKGEKLDWAEGAGIQQCSYTRPQLIPQRALELLQMEAREPDLCTFTLPSHWMMGSSPAEGHNLGWDSALSREGLSSQHFQQLGLAGVQGSAPRHPRRHMKVLGFYSQNKEKLLVCFRQRNGTIWWLLLKDHSNWVIKWKWTRMAAGRPIRKWLETSVPERMVMQWEVGSKTVGHDEWLAGERGGPWLEHLSGSRDCGPWRKVGYQEKAVHSICDGLSPRSWEDAQMSYSLSVALRRKI